MTKFLVGAAVMAMIGGVAIAQTAPQAGAPPRQHVMKNETRADVQTHVQKMFAHLDANHDGFITKVEAAAVNQQREAKLEQRAERFQPDKIFDRLDLNKDGKVTQAEAEAAHNQHAQAKGDQPAQAHAAAFAGMFARADSNKDGVLTRAEFDAMGAQIKARMEKAGAHEGFAGPMFDLADTNKDGRISVPEAQALAFQHFDRADLNHDGTLTPQERQQARERMRGQHPAR